MRFIYARCEIHIHRYDINIESIQNRYDIDKRIIDDVNRHGTDIQALRTEMRFIYARCEIYIHRYDINTESIHDRYEIDIHCISGVFESA